MVDKTEKTKSKKNEKKVKEHDPSNYIDVEPVINEAKDKTVVATWGRFNPVTVGHEKLVNKVITEAMKRKAIPVVYMTHSQDPKKNPLSYDDKIKLGQAAFGRVVQKSNAKTIIQFAAELSKKFDNLVLVVGSDRVDELKVLLNKYNELDYAFKNVEVISAGERDPDADGVKGMSASKMREAATTADDFDQSWIDSKNKKQPPFKSGLPTRLQKDAKKIWNMVRKGMNISESFEETEEETLLERQPLTLQQRRKRGMVMRRYKNKIKAAKKRASRKMATKEKLTQRSRKQAINFMRNRLSKDKKYSSMSPSAKIALDKRLSKISPNVINRIAKRMLPQVKQSERERLSRTLNNTKNEGVYGINEMFELFLESTSKKPQDPDVKDMPGSQPKGYYKGVEKDKKDDRARHFAKHAKMDDDNPDAYKPAPGDKDAKTKPSKHTKKFKDMFGEAARADTKVRKRPHMALEKNGSVKFDKRFKMYKPKDEQIDEGFDDLSEEMMSLISDMDNFYMSEDFENLNESSTKATLKKKAEKTGISYGILKKVFDRGVAAWRTGHRPGTNPTQWGFARVNSFATKGKGTWGKADKDLADKVRKEQFDLSNKEFANLDEQTMLDKVLEKIHNHVKDGEDLKDIINQVTSFMNFGVGGREIERKYIQKYGKPVKEVPVNKTARSTANRRKFLNKYGLKFESKAKKDSPEERGFGTDSLTKKYKEDTPGQSVEEAALDANISRGDIVKFEYIQLDRDPETLTGVFVGTDPKTGRARIRTTDNKVHVVRHDNIER